MICYLKAIGCSSFVAISSRYIRDLKIITQKGDGGWEAGDGGW